MIKEIAQRIGLTALVAVAGCGSKEAPKRENYEPSQQHCYEMAFHKNYCFERDDEGNILAANTSAPEGNMACFYIEGNEDKCRRRPLIKMSPEMRQAFQKAMEANAELLFLHDTAWHQYRKELREEK